MSITSTVTPATNGATPALDKAARRAAMKAAKAALKAAEAKFEAGKAMTAEQACNAAYEYGSSMAGLDGTLTLALKAFKDDETVRDNMLESLNIGYMVRKMGVDKEEGARIVRLLKYNEKKNDDEHRTFEQQRIMDTVRVLWHRANKLAGTLPEKSENQVKAEATRAAKEAEKSAHESRLIAADAIVNPPADVDVFESLVRLVSTMKSLQKTHAKKLTGDRGSAWRDWLANAPK